MTAGKGDKSKQTGEVPHLGDDDDDVVEQTIAMASSPEFDPRVPSPISTPPPALSRPETKPYVPPAARLPLAPPKSAQMAAAKPVAPPFEDEEDPANDGPTSLGMPTGIAGAERPPVSSPLASTGYVPSPASAPKINYDDPEDEEATRAAARNPNVRRQDAHVVIGAGAVGDDATLALAPDAFDRKELAALHATVAANPGVSDTRDGIQGISNALAEALHHGVDPRNAVAEAAAQPFTPPLVAPRPPFQPFPMPQQGQAAPHAYPQQHGPQAAWGHAPLVQQPMQPMMAPYPMQPQPAPLAPSAPSKITPQIIVLVVIAVLCVGIFATGIYLFVTSY